MADMRKLPDTERRRRAQVLEFPIPLCCRAICRLPQRRGKPRRKEYTIMASSFIVAGSIIAALVLLVVFIKFTHA